MSKFERGIKSQAFIDALNLLRKNPNSFWSRMMNDKELYIAIRNESLNVYFQGNSLCELTYKNDQIIGKTHYKFLINPKIKKSYLESANGVFNLQLHSSFFVNSYDDLDLIKRSMSVYRGVEKQGVHTISTIGANVIDVEIAFEKDAILPNIRKSTDRIDFLRLESHNNQTKLVFYEAKLFNNKEIRAIVGAKPPVIDQLHDYIKAIKKHEPDILNSYVLVCRNLHDLGLTKSGDLADTIQNINSLSIDYTPRLVIFGFDQDQKKGNTYTSHLSNLRSFTKCPIIPKGNPSSFKSL